MQAAKTIRTVADNAKQQFVSCNEVIDLMEACILSGQHCLLLGKPGVAKSALVSYFSESLGLRYWRTLLNADTMRDEIYGPLDPKKIDLGIFAPKWQGLATCHLGFIDEVGKASSQVQDLFLNAMEERIATSGDVDENGNQIVLKLPLITLFGATNEYFDDKSPAMWDRFLGRVIVNPIPHTDASGFQRMLTADITPVTVPLTLSELMACNAMTKAMSMNLSAETMTTYTELFSTYPTVSKHYISPRRWRVTLRLAAGRALAEGETTIQPHHLSIAKYTLWSDPDQIPAINDWIDQTTNKAARELNEAKKSLVAIKQSFISMNGSTDLTELAKINMGIDKLIKATQKKQDSEWASLRSDIQKLKQEVLA